MYDKLMDVVNNSGIWKGSRKNSHAFLLSPSVFELENRLREELTLLGFALSDCLLGLSHIATIAFDRKLNYSGAWVLVRKMFSTGIPKVYHDLQGTKIRDIPKLLKVDFMLDLFGNLKIAEIDGHNKHGLGYSTLGLRFREALYPNAKSLPGTVNLLAQEMKRLGHDTLKLFYADQERFYVPEFEVAKVELEKNGVSCELLSEMEVEGTQLEDGLFLDLPFLYHRPELYATILSGYECNKVEFVIPPKPFLGSKAILAFLRNDIGNEDIEALLRCFIRPRSLELVRQYIPETALVGKQAATFEFALERTREKKHVLKEAISSGMHGTVFSDDPNFETILARACLSNMNWILQEEVENKPQTFSWYENGTGAPVLKTAGDWFMRVTVQYVNRALGDVIITARRDKAVHGAKDCLQLGTIVL